MNTKIKLFPVTKSLPQDYELWLEKQELEGWHLKSISFAGWIHYFVKEQPKKIRYCCDYQRKKKKDYETLFKDVGWEFINYSFGTYVWRLEYSDERPEAFSDNITMIGRNNRILSLLLVCTIPYIATIILTIISIIRGKSLSLFNLLFIITIFILYTFIFGGLLITNSKLKKQISR